MSAEGKRYVDCKECGLHEELHWMPSTEEKLLAESLCFDCNFWTEKLAMRDKPTTVRVNGKHYVIGDEGQRGSDWSRGFGGDKWKIKFHDGREVTSTNLWSQGVIPERWRERLPDNAEFIR